MMEFDFTTVKGNLAPILWSIDNYHLYQQYVEHMSMNESTFWIFYNTVKIIIIDI